MATVVNFKEPSNLKKLNKPKGQYILLILIVSIVVVAGSLVFLVQTRKNSKNADTIQPSQVELIRFETVYEELPGTE